MIFSELYDRVLYLILYGDKSNREEIINFIKSIPLEMCEKIRECLPEYDMYSSDEYYNILDRDELNLCGICVTPNNCKYWFNIDMVLGTLNIGRSINNDKDIDITLFRSNDGEISEQLLGYVNFGSSRLGICYEMLNLSIGQIVVSSREGKLKSYRRVNTEKISDSVMDLGKKNRIVRIRNKILGSKYNT